MYSYPHIQVAGGARAVSDIRYPIFKFDSYISDIRYPISDIRVCDIQDILKVGRPYIPWEKKSDLVTFIVLYCTLRL